MVIIDFSLDQQPSINEKLARTRHVITNNPKTSLVNKVTNHKHEYHKHQYGGQNQGHALP